MGIGSKLRLFAPAIVALAVGAVAPVPVAAVGAGAGSSIQAVVCGPAIAPPLIILPAPDTTTTSASITVSGTAAANATVQVNDGGSSVGTVQAASDGSFSLSVPLQLGANDLSAIQNVGCGFGGNSNQVTVTRTVPPTGGSTGTTGSSGTGRVPPTNSTSPAATSTPPPAGSAPTITVPSSGTIVNTVSVLVSGTAPPGATVTITVNGQVVAQLVADSTGRFSGSIPLVLGSNALVASVGGQSSATVTVTRVAAPGATAPQIGGIPGVTGAGSGLALIGWLAALLLLVLGVMLRGWAGLRQLWTLLFGGRRRRQLPRVVDDLTGLPIHLVEVHGGRNRPLRLHKPGYVSCELPLDRTTWPEPIRMQPCLQYHWGFSQELHELLALAGWIALGLALVYGWVLATHGHRSAAILLVVTAILITIGQLLIGRYWAPTRWGCVVTASGEHATGGTVTLSLAEPANFATDTVAVLRTAQITPDGHYALHTPAAGQYVVRAVGPEGDIGAPPPQTTVTCHHPDYITEELRIG